jgi:hypothetical protein
MIAAISGLIPTVFTARVRLWARTEEWWKKGEVRNSQMHDK